MLPRPILQAVLCSSFDTLILYMYINFLGVIETPEANPGTMLKNRAGTKSAKEKNSYRKEER